MRLHSHSRLVLFDLDCTSEHILGRKETGRYIQTNKAGVRIYSAAKERKTVGEIKDAFPDVDVEQFLYELIHEGFVESIDGKKLNNEPGMKCCKLLDGIKSAHVAWLFSIPMQLLYLLLIALGISIMVFNPRYFPSAEDFFFTDNLGFLLIVTILASTVLVFLHELGHYFAARSRDLLARFKISNRYFYIVVITDVTNAYSIRKRDRFRIFLGGMLVDFVILSLCMILLFLADYGAIGLGHILYLLVKYVALIEFITIVWQLAVFLKTDLYYAFENSFEAYNLHDKSYALVKSMFRGEKYSYDSSSDRTAIHAYIIMVVFGAIIAATMVFSYSLPILAGVIERAIIGMTSIDNPQIFYGAVAFGLFVLAGYMILSIVAAKKHSSSISIKYLSTSFLLVCEFLAMMILVFALAVFDENLVWVASALCGILLLVPVRHIWLSLRPTGAVGRRLIAVIVSVCAVSTFSMLFVLSAIQERLRHPMLVHEVIFYFIAGLVAYLLGELAVQNILRKR